MAEAGEGVVQLQLTVAPFGAGLLLSQLETARRASGIRKRARMMFLPRPTTARA
jgi:hypothetical protein